MKIRLVFLVAVLWGCAQKPGATECETGIICPPNTKCAGTQPICIINECGDGLPDPGEECDDGNIMPGDTCSPTCQIESCGNGVLDPGEACDVGDTTPGDGCSPTCQVEECGNLVIDFGETCDDGAKEPADGCSPLCQTEICGNGVKDPGEQCDDGPIPGGCNDDCEGGEGCGDGAIDLDPNGDPLEECDDGNASDDDDCLSSNTSAATNCKISTCGDGIRQTAGHNLEECDTAGESAACNGDCTVSDCGDGKVNKADGEQCDDGAANADNADCTAGCVVNVCNDGLHNTVGPENIEQCDDGNLSETDGCSTACTTPFCGNGIVDQLEECDFGSLNNDNGACRLNCKINVCGDGKVRTGVEQCDDGDTLNGTNNCSSICRNEVCGNGTKDPLEACDDGNTTNGDGCNSLCEIETCGDGVDNDITEECDTGGESATCNANCTLTECGDGIVNEAAGEQCDELNSVNTDDCISNNHPNPALRCKLNVCGDGVQDNVGPRTEACDDGNLVNTDGCTNSCTLPSCGNGVRDLGEQCDDGNAVLTDACVNCNDAFCGDGRTRAGVEQCDDGNATSGDGCDTNCKTTACGNGIKTGTEQCDDGNTANGDGCSSTCALERCGNGIEDPGEECDPGAAGETATCNADCTDVECGDGLVNTTAGEQCDELNAINTDDCISNNHPTVALRCKLNRCGDGVIDTVGPRIDACDDGNLVNNDGCSNSCTTPLCGNGILDQGEQCDDGNTSDADGCLSSNTPGQPQTNCRIAICGDGVRRTVGASGLEECDDGNAVNTDDCLTTCKLNDCGDGFQDLQGPATEACDDGNENTEAKCPYNVINCQVCNATCTALVARTGDFCGDGTPNLADGEVCDDGNRVTETVCPYGDSPCSLCRNDCKAPLALTGPTCGDGSVEPNVEVCDDRNADDCGTCNSTCTVAQTAKAEGFIFPASGADYAVGGTDTFTLDDGINAPKTFQFTDATPTGSNIKIDRVPADSSVSVRNKIVAAINGVGDQLRITATAAPGSNPTVLLNHDFTTEQGNADIVDNVATPNFGVFGMTGGEGGDCPAATSCNADDVCESFDCTGANVCAP